MRGHSRAQKSAALARNSGPVRSRNVARKAFLRSAAGKICPERPLMEPSLPMQAKTLGINTRNRKIHSETFPSHATNLHCAQEPPSGSRKQDRRGGLLCHPPSRTLLSSWKSRANGHGAHVWVPEALHRRGAQTAVSAPSCPELHRCSRPAPGNMARRTR